jgi:hypothetical protein
MYGELIQRLRETSMDFGESDHVSVMLLEAADAIEEQQKLNCELLFRVGQAEALIDYYQTGRMISNAPPKEERVNENPN